MSYDPGILTDEAHADLILEVEDARQVQGPNEKLIDAEVSRLNHSHPSFLVLGHAGGSYAQVLGGPQGYVAEIRVVHDKTYEHFNVYRHGLDPGPQVHVEGSSGGVNVPEAERLNKDQALRTLVAFARNHALPADLALIDLTANHRRRDQQIASGQTPSPDSLRTPIEEPLEGARIFVPPSPDSANAQQPAPAQPGLIKRIRSLLGI